MQPKICPAVIRLPLSLSLSLSNTQTFKHTHSITHTHTNTFSLHTLLHIYSLSHSYTRITHTYTHSLSLSLSLSHTHTHTHTSEEQEILFVHASQHQIKVNFRIIMTKRSTLDKFISRQSKLSRPFKLNFYNYQILQLINLKIMHFTINTFYPYFLFYCILCPTFIVFAKVKRNVLGCINHDSIITLIRATYEVILLHPSRMQ